MNQFICLFVFVHSIHVGPSPPNPPVNQTTLADVTVQLPATYDPVKNVVTFKTGGSSQAQESVCVHGRTSVEQVANNSIGSESSKPSLFTKTCML